jgi:DNA-binding IscR family transcriptional regulator
MAFVPCMPPIECVFSIARSCLLVSAMEDARDAFLGALDGYTLARLTTPRTKLQKLLAIPQVIQTQAG